MVTVASLAASVPEVDCGGGDEATRWRNMSSAPEARGGHKKKGAYPPPKA